MKAQPTLQSVIMQLQQFWADQGCVIWQPYYTQVGAGTMNPATALRVLGPEPWRVAYVEPSIRPDDGRYGENPNRMQQFYQFQVILKPDPGNPQEVYLRSLLALGVDPAEHDLRFVEDDWESPALGASGLGWEVWLDGQEITQFTYFQKSGGIMLDPVSVEITYGLERIVMALQPADAFTEIHWNDKFTYGDINLQGEREHSRYYFEVADVDRLRTMYQAFDKEAEAAIGAGLILPAHDYILKCSHTFNILDTRGAIGVTERAAMFSRMRELSRRVAETYLAKRKELGFPWRDVESTPQGKVKKAAEADHQGKPAPKEPAPFLFEIGIEELPVAELNLGLTQLDRLVKKLLLENRLKHGNIQVMGTPRRMVVYVEELAPLQKGQTFMLKGPSAARAFDAKGNPTKAAAGFARSKGVPLDALKIQEVDGGRYVVAEVCESGKPTAKILQKMLQDLLAGIRFEKSMRWNASGATFSRPIRWILALYGEHCIPFEYAGVKAGQVTRSLRFWKPEEVTLRDPAMYFATLEKQGILINIKARRKAIQEQVISLAAEVDGRISDDADLLAEVANLVEAPAAVRGRFDKTFLELPQQVLISVMKKHQRYFPVMKGNKLLPYFIAVRNGDHRHLEVVAQGNEHVLRARFEDAAYFIHRDRKRSLESFLPKLERLTFQAELGSMLDKAKRIECLTEVLVDKLGLSEKDKAIANRAAHLCKADLATEMVIEMTSLQGVMGHEYALHSGESPKVAEAILEHYLPRFSGDHMPKSRAGLLVGLADRLDTLMGLFAAGLRASGTHDPYAMRRTANGLVQELIGGQIHFNLGDGLSIAAEHLPIAAPDSIRKECLEFIIDRQQGQLISDGYRHDVVAAVLSGQGYDPYGAFKAAKELAEWVKREEWPRILQAYARCVRITRDQDQLFSVDSKLCIENAERRMFDAIEKAISTERAPGSVDEFFKVFLPMMPPITTFFDEVLVMAEDKALRSNRLGMLQQLVALADGVADFSKLEGF